MDDAVTPVVGPGDDDDGQGLDAEAFTQFLQQQQQDLALRREEQDIRRSELELRREEVQLEKVRQERSFDYALRALEIDKARGERRDAAEVVSSKASIWLLMAILVGIIVIVVLAMYWNKEGFIAEIFRYGIAVLGGGGVGFTVGRGSAKSDDTEKIDPPLP